MSAPTIGIEGIFSVGPPQNRANRIAPPALTKEEVAAFEQLPQVESQYENNIDEYTRRNWPESKLAALTTIPGAFHKVRDRGGASFEDVDRMNSTYRRCAGTFCLLFLHTYVVTMFMYESKSLTKRTSPFLFQRLPFIAYPAAFIFSAGFTFSRVKSTMDQLDWKYSPMWHDIQNEENSAIN